MVAATATMPAATATTAMPIGVSRWRRQQTGGNRRRDQKCLEAQHGFRSFVSFHRNEIWAPTVVGLRQHRAGLMISG
jgi:hypothetical protein